MADTVIHLDIRVSDGSFESRISIPVNSTKEQREGMTQMWLQQLTLALALPTRESNG